MTELTYFVFKVSVHCSALLERTFIQRRTSAYFTLILDSQYITDTCVSVIPAFMCYIE